MRLSFPTCTDWLRSALHLLAAVFAGALACAQEEGDGEPVVEVIKQLAFIEQQFEEGATAEALKSPYDVVVAPDGGHVYVASFSRHAISYFSRNGENGELSFGGLANASTIRESALNGVKALATSPDGLFVYGVSQLSDSLAAFSRNTGSGALSFVDAIYDTDGGVDGLNGARSLVISPDGKNIYVAAYDDNKVSVYSRNVGTGVPSFLGVYEEGDQGVEELTDPHALAMSPDGKHLYVALWKNEIVVFSRDSSTGLLTYESKVAYLTGEIKKESSRDLVFSPDGKFAYVISTNNDAMSVFSRDAETGALTLEGNLFDEQGGVVDMDGPHAISISADGAYLYVAAFGSDSVTAFERDSETGLASYYQSVHPEAEDEWSMNAPLSIGTSPDGEHVYVGAGFSGSTLVTFRRELLLDPPELVVLPVDQSIEEGEDVAFYALAQGVELSYQWLKNGSPLSGQTLPVLTLASVSSSDEGSAFSIQVSNAGGVATSGTALLTVLPPVVVQAPLDLTALDISSNSAQLAWSDESDNETHFEIQRRELGGEFATIATVSANQSQYEDSTLAASTTYIYRLRAKRNENVSLWSNDAVIESYDDVPQAPVNLLVSEEHYNRVELRWSDRSAVEDGFRIVRRADTFGSAWETVAILDKNITSYLDRSVEPQSTYAYRLQAYNESGYSDYSNSVVAITGTVPVDAITPASRTIARDAISGYTIAVSSSEDWEALSEVDWLIVTSPAGGLGSGNEGVIYRSRLNESQDERTGKIVVGGMEHTVVQEGSPPFLRVSPSRTLADAEGGTEVVNVEANLDWTASESADWVAISSGNSGSGYGSIVLELAANDSFDTRYAELSINSSTHVIEQAGLVPQLDLSLDVSRFAADGGTGSLSISSNISWSASVSDPWITLAGADSGGADGSLPFTVAPNETGEVRTADILVNDQAVTVTQDPPLQSEVLEPEWVRATVGSLGVELEWLDLSDDELGFRIRRRIVGAERVFDVATLEADATSYFDRDAPRGEQVEYALVSYDEVGESDEVFTTTELIPSANITRFALRVEADPASRAFLAGILLAGKGQLAMQLDGAGAEFEAMSFGRPYQSALYAVDTDMGGFSLVAEYPPKDWMTELGVSNLLGEAAIDAAQENVLYAAESVGEGGAFPRGGRAMGQLRRPGSVVFAGFEIEGEMELPVLLQAVGASLVSEGVSDPAAGLELSLYALSDQGVPTLVATNANAADWMNDSDITIEDALGKTGARTILTEGPVEARLLLMLGAGRYAAVLSSGSGSVGTAMLEVYDAR